MRALAVALVAAAVAALLAVPAGAVHESYHGPFLGTTSQDQRLIIRVTSHTRIGIRFRWRGKCEHGSVLRIARFRNVRVSEDGRFFHRSRLGVGVRGKIGFDAMGNPVFPEPYSFANNEAKGRLRATVNFPFDSPDRGVCRSGLVTWEARR
jgi:hypothetical protein